MPEAYWHFCRLQGLNEGGQKQIKERFFPIAARFGKRKTSSLLEEANGSSFLKWSFLQLRDLFRCSSDRLLATDWCRYPYKETTVNEWFVQSFSDGAEQKDVNIINVTKDGRARKCYTTQIGTQASDFLTSLSDDNFEVFVHGTNESSAKNIIEEGIKNTNKTVGQDFSRGDGFYLSKSLEKAMQWAFSRYSRGVIAAIVFRVDKKQLRDNHKGWDLQGPEKKKEWQEAVQEFRSGNPNKAFFREFKRNEYDYCEGPMATTKGRRDPTPIDDTYEMCVYVRRTCPVVDLFNRSLHSVLFFERK